MTKYSLKIGWLYPTLMSTYGDRGNVISLTKRCEWRDISVTILSVDTETTDKQLESIDLLFGGGAQDREQEIVMRNLMKKKHAISSHIERGMPALFVCGAPQLMGKYYEPAEGKRIEGLGIFDMVSKHPGKDAKRLIGNIIAEVVWESFLGDRDKLPNKTLLVGFENHGGRTQLGPQAKPFAKVLKGNGNNGEDGTEGVIYKNAIGCYFHGPLLPKNPVIADWLISTALKVKYAKPVELSSIDDTLEIQAHHAIAKKLGIAL